MPQVTKTRIWIVSMLNWIASKWNRIANKRIIDIKIIESYKHFLYLPLHYAEKNNFFGLIPEGYHLEIVTASESCDITPTDEIIYKAMKKHSAPSKVGGDNITDIQYAVADPMVVFSDNEIAINEDNTPVIIAGLLNNSSFWILDHTTNSNTIKVNNICKIFTKIISFQQGSTSYGIARKMNYADEAITVVPPGTEVSKFTSYTRENNKDYEQTILLTPDILGISELMSSHNNEYNIILSLGKTAEYRNMIVTALITTKHIINNHRDLTEALVRAIHIASLLVQYMDDDIIEYAKSCGTEGRDPISEDVVKNALNNALSCQVFPTSLEITKANWETTVSIAVNKNAGETDKNKIANIYNTRIQPYSYISHNAMKYVIKLVKDKVYDVPLFNKFTVHDCFILFVFSILSILSLFPRKWVFVLSFVIVIILSWILKLFTRHMKNYIIFIIFMFIIFVISFFSQEDDIINNICKLSGIITIAIFIYSLLKPSRL